jgi:hypothetical protein
MKTLRLAKDTGERKKMQADNQNLAQIGTLKLFLIATGFASVMGLAMRLIQNELVTKRDVVYSLFISACAGVLIGLFTHDMFVSRGQTLVWIGLVAVAGIGAHSVFELFFAWIIKILSAKLGVRKKRRRNTRERTIRKDVSK